MEGGVDTPPMSASELKARLYQTFRERGLAESLKSQLRTKLVTELRQGALLQQVRFGSDPGAVTPPSGMGPSPLMLRAANSLIADHLRRCGYDYSLAVFLPESGSAQDKIFTVPDLLDLLRISPTSQTYKKLAVDLPHYDAKGFLWQLLSELSAGRATGQEHVGVQVEEYPLHQSSIERKLQNVEEVYTRRREEDEITTKHAVQEKLLRMRRELEAKSREEITREISRFKENELKRVELEERDKARKEIASARREMESTYQLKSDALRDREQATMERLQKHQELIEKETYAQRQSLLEELRVIRQREADLRREVEINARAAKMEEDKRKALEDNLKFREASVSNIESTYDQRLKEESKRLELDYEARIAKRLHDVEQKEAKVRAEQRRVTEERESLKMLQDQLKNKTSQVLELETLLKEAKSEMASSNNRSDLLNERLRTMVDYPSLKEENTILRRDLEHAKMRSAELGRDFKSEQSRHEELIKQLTERMSRPSPEVQALRSELDQAREQLSQEKAMVQHMEAQWKTRLQEEMDTNRDLRHRLSEQTNEMASLMRQLADLKLALRQTQTALNNNIYHADRSQGLGLGGDIHNSTLADDPYIDTSLHRTTLGPELRLADAGGYQLPLDDSNSGEDDEESRGDSLAFIEHTKARFRELEREAAHLEQNYQELQHRMSGVGGLHRTPQHPVVTATTRETSLTDLNGSVAGIIGTGSQPPIAGSRQRNSEVLGSSSGKRSSKVPKTSATQGTPTQPTRLQNSPSPRSSDHSGVGTKSSSRRSSTSSASSAPLKLTASDLRGPGSAVATGVEQSSPAITGSGLPERGAEPGATQSSEEKEMDRRKRAEEEEARKERQQAEEEKRKTEEKKTDVKEEERRRLVEEERRRRLAEEEEEEQRRWEEKRRQKEEERRRKEQEAREREQRMLLELQQQEQAGDGAKGVAASVEPRRDANEMGVDDAGTKKEGRKDDREEEEGEEEEEKAAGGAGSEGIKIDPMMQRYMMMVQQRKQQQDSGKAATPEPEVIPDSPSLSIKSDGSISGEEMQGVEKEASTGKVSDNDDPFGDW
ncbi:centriole and centriolar satellite protein OFD1-like [Diadema antillarum]|uniref:centriole and centriolar satellite protein OFD1-like n=1 Tax=Diadema antillarum TaxID=105358 RepID=UPI003A84FD44